MESGRTPSRTAGSSPPAPRMAMAPAAGGMKRPAHGGEPNAPKAPRMNSGAEAAEQVLARLS